MHRVGRWLVVLVILGVAGAAVWLYASEPLPENDLADLGANVPDVRQAAVRRLADAGQFDELVYELTRSHKPLVKTGLAEAIHTMGVANADLDALLELLSDSDPATRHLAVGLLATEAPAVWRDLDAVADDAEETVLVRAAAAAALGGAGVQARASLQDLARDTEIPRAVRGAAIRALAKLSPAGADDVRKIAEDATRPWEERALAVAALSPKSSPSDTALTLLASSTTPRLRAAALAAMAAHGSTSHLSTVAAKLTDAWANVRYEALRALQALGGTTTYRSQVIGRLLDADPRLQALSARIVGGTCSDIASSVIPSLKALLASKNFRVRYEAAMALLALGDTSGRATMQADRALPNPSHALLASQAYSAITAAKK